MAHDPRSRRPPPPLDPPALERLALRYVERFQTTRGKLADYLKRKARERGWDGEGDPAVLAAGIAERMTTLGYVDDAAFAEAKAASMARRGLGARRIGVALRQAGVGEAERDDLAPVIIGRGWEAALAFARRRRIGPFAPAPADPAVREKQIAAMARAGHGFAIARRIAAAAPGEAIDAPDRDDVLAEDDPA